MENSKEKERIALITANLIDQYIKQTIQCFMYSEFAHLKMREVKSEEEETELMVNFFLKRLEYCWLIQQIDKEILKFLNEFDESSRKKIKKLQIYYSVKEELVYDEEMKSQITEIQKVLTESLGIWGLIRIDIVAKRVKKQIATLTEGMYGEY